MSRMYEENRKSKNAFVGCLHNCVYCKPSFQRQAKRFEGKGYDFQPRYHPERLLKAPPRTEEGEFIFFPSMGDLAFATSIQIQAHIDYAQKYPDRTFLTQSKNPQWFHDYSFPENMILGATVETNMYGFDTPSEYHYYSDISLAPLPHLRLASMATLLHKRKALTIEPILQFRDYAFLDAIKKVNPELIWVGYDNHNCKLPEPLLSETMSLIKMLREDFDVRTKTLRKAWYEEASE